MKRLILASLATAVVPAAADAGMKKPGEHLKGCKSTSCDHRIGREWWRRKHPRARAASFVAPYRAWLNKVAMCESTNNTRAVSPNGVYRGLFQFDLQTWRSVGGTGDPINATRGEQEYRAVLLLRSRGTSPWPVCG
jgi:hypothetical protein